MTENHIWAQKSASELFITLFRHIFYGFCNRLSNQDFKTERNTILNTFSFLSKGIVIHTIRSILGTWNVLYCNAKSIENFWHYVQCCFFVCSFVCLRSRPYQFQWNVSVRIDGRFYSKSTLLKCFRRAKTDRISKNFTPNQYTYAKRPKLNEPQLCAINDIFDTNW